VVRLTRIRQNVTGALNVAVKVARASEYGSCWVTFWIMVEIRFKKGDLRVGKAMECGDLSTLERRGLRICG
jgi:hypothetical protein